MAIPKLETDVRIVSQIPNYPGSEGGLSPEAFKEKFDEAPQIIKDFINNVLIAELNSLVDVQALLNNVIDNTLTLPDKAAGAKATGDALGKKLSITGGTLQGVLNMSGNEVQQVGYPSAGSSAVNRSYVDNKHKNAEVVLPASGWSDAAPYTQTIAVEGILAADRPHYGVVYSDNWETEKEAFSAVDELDTADGSVTFTCFEDKPSVDLTIQMEVNR